jgi:catechol 2,3-dioxygenase-like lactoylglutathione lyase family enzyme
MTVGSVFNHVGHCVADVERSRRFYEEVLGFEFWREIEPPDEMTTQLLDLPQPAGLRAVYLRQGEFVLELLGFRGVETLPPARPRVMNEIGLTHISVSVDDIDATAAKAAAYGGRVLEQTHVGAAVMIRDPDGQLIELLPMGYRASLPD